MIELRLPIHFEDVIAVLGGQADMNAKLMQFVQPVEHAERDVMEVARLVGPSGKLALLLGPAGSGKSTFLQSLSWRRHLGFAKVANFDATKFASGKALAGLLDVIRDEGERSHSIEDIGKTVLVIDYLEDLSDFSEGDVRGFFRSLNGLLRRYPLLVIWPVTSASDADKMIGFASAVSGTIFHRRKEVINFRGPPLSSYLTIAENTIGVLNEGHTLEDFCLTREDFEKVLETTKSRGSRFVSLRNYFEDVKEYWGRTSGFLDEFRKKIPRPTEVWFIFSHSEAENVVSQFARKSTEPSEAWKATHSKLYEYLHDNQRAADWDPRRLQFAIGGAFLSRILFCPTSALVAVFASHDEGTLSALDLRNQGLPSNWLKPREARKQLSNTPFIRQLRGEPAKMGKRRSGKAADAMKLAQPVYAKIADWTAGKSKGSDQHLNRVLAKAIALTLDVPEDQVVAGAPHPWIPNIIPDIRVDCDPDRHICVEMCYTNRTSPHVVADYVLKKLDRYMKQLTVYLGPKTDLALAMAQQPPERDK